MCFRTAGSLLCELTERFFQSFSGKLMMNCFGRLSFLCNCSRVPCISWKGSWSQDVVLHIHPNFWTYIISVCSGCCKADQFLFGPCSSFYTHELLLTIVRSLLHFTLLSANTYCMPSFFLSGQDDYDRLRPLSYQEANLILVCFDVTNPTSFENVLIKVIIYTVH